MKSSLKKNQLNQKGDNTYEKDSLEFNRVISLSDAVFAIAMTLLVLTLDVPDVSPSAMAEALTAQLTQFTAFALSFILVAIIWTQHHKFMASLSKLEPVLIGLNLVLLGVVVAVPYPTNLIGNDPSISISVVIFISVFLLLSLLYLLMTIRAHIVNAWSKPVSTEYFIWMLSSWGAGIVVMLVAMSLAFSYPLIALAILAISMIFGPLASKLTYRE